MTDDDDAVPILMEYRGIGIHTGQSSERIEAVVKPEIDCVFELTDVEALFDHAVDVTRSPESRLFAAPKVEAAWKLAAESRRLRPDVNLGRLRACVASSC
jgi:hypothetical protein